MPILANIFQPLIDVFEAVMIFYHDSLGVGWGVAIILLTVSVRALLIPLTLKQFRSMQALTRLQPEIKKLQSKYKDDRQRLNQEMMKFYQENKVNPFGSCLPLVAQLPVFLALFYMLRTDLRTDICDQTAKPCGEIAGSTAEKFLFIPDLTGAATGRVLIALVVMYVGSQLLSSVLMSVTADKNQRMLLIALPFLFVPFILSFPAGLLVYWITTNLWTIVQQYIVRRRVGPMVLPSLPGSGGDEKNGGDGDGKDGDGKPPAGLFGALARRAEAGAKPNGAALPVVKTPSGPPPPSPRKKKKRSGRRR